jgi:hypothetical protein
MKERFVCWSKEVVRLLQGEGLGGLLGWERSVFVVLNINEINSHLLGCLDANHERRTLTSCNDLMWVMDRLEEQSKGALKFRDDCFSKHWELDVWVLLVNVLCQLRNSLCIGLSFEFVAFAFEKGLQFLVVGDDAIMYDREFPVWIGSIPIMLRQLANSMAIDVTTSYDLPVWMAIKPGRTAMGSPSCVCNASVRVEDLGEIWLLFCNELLELDHFADLLEGKNFISLVSIHGKAGGVISTIFEAGES